MLAVRRGDTVTNRDLDDVELRRGDTLLLQTTAGAIAYLADRDEVMVTREAEDPGDLGEAAHAEASPAPLDPRTPIAAGILLAVIVVAALGLFPIVIAALGGVVAMIVTGCLIVFIVSHYRWVAKTVRRSTGNQLQ